MTSFIVLTQTQTFNSCGGTCTCASGGTCIFDCDGWQDCKSGSLNGGVGGSGATSMLVICTGEQSCQDASIDCGTAAVCEIRCTAPGSDPQVCSGNFDVDCGTSKCSLQCSNNQCDGFDPVINNALSFECSGNDCPVGWDAMYFTVAPTPQPTPQPTNQPTLQPIIQTPQPTSNPTSNPTLNPTPLPTNQPTANPTNIPTLQPTIHPTPFPTSQPTPVIPTTSTPTTDIPSKTPTKQPTTSLPTTASPTTKMPTKSPLDPGQTHSPSKSPTDMPSLLPTISPTTNQATTLEGGVDETTERPIGETQDSGDNKSITNDDSLSTAIYAVIGVVASIIVLIIFVFIIYKIYVHNRMNTETETQTKMNQKMNDTDNQFNDEDNEIVGVIDLKRDQNDLNHDDNYITKIGDDDEQQENDLFIKGNLNTPQYNTDNIQKINTPTATEGDDSDSNDSFKDTSTPFTPKQQYVNKDIKLNNDNNDEFEEMYINNKSEQIDSKTKGIPTNVNYNQHTIEGDNDNNDFTTIL